MLTWREMDSGYRDEGERAVIKQVVEKCAEVWN